MKYTVNYIVLFGVSLYDTDDVVILEKNYVK